MKRHGIIGILFGFGYFLKFIRFFLNILNSLLLTFDARPVSKAILFFTTSSLGVVLRVGLFLFSSSSSSSFF